MEESDSGVDLTYGADEAVECEGVESKGYPANGLSRIHPLSPGHHQWDWRLAKIVSDQERRGGLRIPGYGPACLCGSACKQKDHLSPTAE